MKTFNLKLSWRAMLIIVLVIFLIEVGIMFLLRRFIQHPNIWIEVLSDSTLLVVLLLPALYYFMLRPMEREIALREQADRNLQETNNQLELSVKYRTAELEIAISRLETEIVERKRSEEALRTSETRFRSLFENAPISLWEEDFSLVVAYMDELRRSEVTDFRAYFETHPDAVADCVRMVKIIDINETTLRLYQARTKEDFLQGIDRAFCEESFPVFREEIIALAEGKTRFDGEAINQTLKGDKIHIAISSIVAPSSDGPSHRIFVAISDITKYKQAEQIIQQNNEKLARSATELKMRNREMALLSEMGGLFQACQTSEEAYTVIAQFASRLFTTESGGLSVFNASRNALNVMVNWGQAPVMQRGFDPNACWALRRGRLHVEDDTGSGMVCSHLTQQSLVASLCVPLVAQGDTLGVFTLISTVSPETNSARLDQESRPFSETKLQLATAFAEHIGLALANLYLREALRHQAIRDPLTNLYNRRYMGETLGRELKRAERKRTQLGVIMLDIDHFKRFNDTFGHEAGDIILRELGNFFQTHIREEDIACRYGGEEFTLILPDSSLVDICKRAEDLREGIKQLNARYNGMTLGAITLSFGISAFPEHGETSEGLLRAADQALYRAKAEGRDRVVVAS